MNTNAASYWHQDAWLIRVVIIKWKLPPFSIWLVSSLIPIVVFGFVALLLGDFRSHDDTIGFINDIDWLKTQIIGIPPVVMFYFIFPGFVLKCLKNLEQNEVFREPKAKFLEKNPNYSLSTFYEDIRSSMFQKRWLIAAVAITGAFMATAIPVHLGYQSWYVDYLPVLITTELLWSLGFVVTVALGFRALISVWWINQAFKRFEVNIRPLFPDGSGGLLPLSQFSLQLGYIFFFFGLTLATNQYSTSFVKTGELGRLLWSTDTIIAWIAYLVFAPILFFAPISSAHDAMRDAKNDELLVVSKGFEQEYQSLRNELDHLPEALDVETQFKKIRDLQELYRLVKSFPVWPFQLEKFLQFTAAVVSPLLLTILSSLVSTWVANIQL